VKKSIFWELSYWHTNLIRYNLDVMHIEKKLFDNIFYTVADYPDQLRILNWRGKLKRKLKFTRGTNQKTKIKRIRIKFEKKKS
jgi:hypothetical protein